MRWEGSWTKKVFLVILCLVVLSVGYAWFTAPPDPVYDGKHLSEHLFIYYARRAPGWYKGQKVTDADFQKFRTEWEASKEVLRNLDEQSIPLLRAWLNRPAWKWAPKAAAVLTQVGLHPPSLRLNRQLAACDVLQWNPEVSAALLPDVREFFASTNAYLHSASTAAFTAALYDPAARAALVQGGAGSSSDLLQALRAGTREEAVYSAGLFWAACKEKQVPNAEELLPQIIEIGRQRASETLPPANTFIMLPIPAMKEIGEFRTRSSGLKTTSFLYNAILLIDPDWRHRHLLTLELGPEADRVGAAWALSNTPTEPEKAIPLLMANLSSTNRALIENCAIALGKYGPPAEPALPLLTNLFTHRKLAIRMAASNAISQIRVSETGSRP